MKNLQKLCNNTKKSKIITIKPPNDQDQFLSIPKIYKIFHKFLKITDNSRNLKKFRKTTKHSEKLLSITKISK